MQLGAHCSVSCAYRCAWEGIVDDGTCSMMFVMSRGIFLRNPSLAFPFPSRPVRRYILHLVVLFLSILMSRVSLVPCIRMVLLLIRLDCLISILQFRWLDGELVAIPQIITTSLIERLQLVSQAQLLSELIELLTLWILHTHLGTTTQILIVQTPTLLGLIDGGGESVVDWCGLEVDT